jgi:hypothetical protein
MFTILTILSPLFCSGILVVYIVVYIDLTLIHILCGCSKYTVYIYRNACIFLMHVDASSILSDCAIFFNGALGNN